MDIEDLSGNHHQHKRGLLIHSRLLHLELKMQELFAVLVSFWVAVFWREGITDNDITNMAENTALVLCLRRNKQKEHRLAAAKSSAKQIDDSETR